MNDAPIVVLKAHVSLNVENVQASIDFYRRMFDIDPVKIRTGYAKFDVNNPPLNLTLNERKIEKSATKNASHFGLQVASTDDVLAIRECWKEAGLQPRDEMQAVCCFALQDKAWVTDPDGNEWEVFNVLENVEADTGSCCGGGSCEQEQAQSEKLVSIITKR